MTGNAINQERPESGGRDPFGVLGLLPSAPKELVIEVYWHMAGRLLANAHRTPELDQELERLNAAYASVMETDRLTRNGTSASLNGSAARDAAKTHKRVRGAGKATPASRKDPWRALHLQRGAAPEVIALAYEILQDVTRKSSGEDTDDELDTLRESYGLLKDSRPDERTARAPGAAEPGDESTDTRNDKNERRPPNPEDVNGRPRLSVLRSIARRFTNRRGDAGAGEPVPEDTDEAGPGEPVSEEEMLRPYPTVEANDTAHDPPTGERSKKDPVPAEARVAEVEGPVAVVDAFPAQPAGSEEPSSAEAAGLVLREEIPAGYEPEVRSRHRNSGATKAFLEMESGERLTEIGDAPLTIGTDPASDVIVASRGPDEGAVHARIWLQGDRFMFHRLAPQRTVLINGESPAWAVLEDGDRLQVGRAIFWFRIPGKLAG